MTVYLVPAGRGRFELYSEAPEEIVDAPPPRQGRFRRWAHQATVQWRQLVDKARHGGATGRFARWRDAVVCKLAESIAEQRTLWALRTESDVTVLYPSRLDDGEVRKVVSVLLAHSRQHHLRWILIDGLLFILSGLLFLIPGPNLVAYYFAFRLVGHLQSWRGARHAMEKIRWTYTPDRGLDELASLVDVPRAARGPKVEAIAARLNLPRLSAFFDRIVRI